MSQGNDEIRNFIKSSRDYQLTGYVKITSLQGNFPDEISMVVEIGEVAIYRPFGEFRRAKSYCHLYGAQGQRQAYP
ncbi:hypothetical protein TNCV_2549031 [Trichonephila clavipes]|nr:hypothetical protein TNCV_2549031 [Trichonephila clavipes]